MVGFRMRPSLRVSGRLPSKWPRSRGMVGQADIRINESRLAAKLLVFEKPRDLHNFWAKYLKRGHLGRRCLGAVNALASYAEHPATGRRRMTVDARYFCVVGLCRGHLTMRIISHEAVHAGYAFAKRRARSWWDAQAKHFDEEAIAYPVGEIAAGIVSALGKMKMLPE